MERGTHESWDPRPGSRLPALLGFLPLCVWAFGWVGVMLLTATLLPKVFGKRKVGMLHIWGKGCLLLSGVRLETHGLEHLEAPGARILLFNHQSLMDLFVLTAAWPSRGVVIYKQEFHKIPIIGRCMKALDFIAVDRSDRAKAIRSMREAGRRITERGEVLLVAPEGTRSRVDGLLPFKRGPFYLATQTKVPLNPFLMRGVRTLMPMGSWLAHSGTLRLDVLEDIPTAHWTKDDMEEQVEAVRQVFLRYLPDSGLPPEGAEGAGAKPADAPAKPVTSGRD